MSDCCHSAYGDIFDEKRARADARSYRRRGPDRQSSQIVALLSAPTLAGSTILEVGGGVGVIQLELLKAGAERAICVELSPEYERVAAELLAEAHLEDRVERRVGDFVEMNGHLPVADVVVMNKVVCCYPDMPALMATAASHARRHIVLTLPHDGLLFRLAVRVANGFLRLRRSAFRGFVHRHTTLLEAAAAAGFALTEQRSGRIWKVLLLERTAA